VRNALAKTALWIAVAIATCLGWRALWRHMKRWEALPEDERQKEWLDKQW
jgi:hypothetical protein